MIDFEQVGNPYEYTKHIHIVRYEIHHTFFI
jgi:hypothetical protein